MSLTRKLVPDRTYMLEAAGRLFPAAIAELRRGAECWLWRVPHCPLCGKQHIHGGGPFDGDPRRLLGHRSVHCAKGFSSYILVEGRGETAVILGKVKGKSVEGS